MLIRWNKIVHNSITTYAFFFTELHDTFLVYAWPKLPFDIFINHKILSIKHAYDAINGNVKIQITSEVGAENIRIY